MMKRDPLVYVGDILESIARIEDYTKGKGLEDFKKDVQLQDSVMRRLEIIGEAAKNMPPEIKKKCAGIPWKEIAGMRDVLIHAYFGINPERVWNAVEGDLPKLKSSLLKIRKELQK